MIPLGALGDTVHGQVPCGKKMLPHQQRLNCVNNHRGWNVWHRHWGALRLVQSRVSERAAGRISYPVSIGLFSICTSASDFAHLEQVSARFAVILASLATARASLSWLVTSLPLPKYISSGVWPLNAECGMTRLCWFT